MEKFVALFRGINVGGNNRLPMKYLVALLGENNYQGISTYIQSGNLILSSTENPASNIESIVSSHYHFAPKVFALPAIEFSKYVESNPYADYEGKFVHFYFCDKNISVSVDKVTKYISPTEQYSVIDNVFYFHAPEGIGRSKLITNIEAVLGQPSTGRNLNTINKLNAMLDTPS